MKHSWVMYVFLLLLAVVLLKNAAGSVGLIMASSTGGANLATALTGGNSAKASTGSFALGGGQTIKLG